MAVQLYFPILPIPYGYSAGPAVVITPFNSPTSTTGVLFTRSNGRSNRMKTGGSQYTRSKKRTI